MMSNEISSVKPSLTSFPIWRTIRLALLVALGDIIRDDFSVFCLIARKSFNCKFFYGPLIEKSQPAAIRNYVVAEGE